MAYGSAPFFTLDQWCIHSTTRGPYAISLRDLDPPLLDGLFELLVVAAVLLRICLGERDDGLIEDVALLQISSDLRGVTGFRMGPRQVPPAELGIVRQPGG
jgi:hypothetical protein